MIVRPLPELKSGPRAKISQQMNMFLLTEMQRVPIFTLPMTRESLPLPRMTHILKAFNPTLVFGKDAAIKQATLLEKPDGKRRLDAVVPLKLQMQKGDHVHVSDIQFTLFGLGLSAEQKEQKKTEEFWKTGTWLAEFPVPSLTPAGQIGGGLSVSKIAQQLRIQTVPNAKQLLNMLKRCRDARGVLVVTPEQRQSLLLKFYEVNSYADRWRRVQARLPGGSGTPSRALDVSWKNEDSFKEVTMLAESRYAARFHESPKYYKKQQEVKEATEQAVAKKREELTKHEKSKKGAVLLHENAVAAKKADKEAQKADKEAEGSKDAKKQFV